MEIVDSIDALLKKVDAVIVTSVDGRPHLVKVKPVLEAGKPVFIDKPLAGTLADCVAIYACREAPCSLFFQLLLALQPGHDRLGRSGEGRQSARVRSP